MDRDRPRFVGAIDVDTLDLTTAVSRDMDASAFLDFMRREWDRIQNEQARPAYLPCRPDADVAWFLAKWGPVPDGQD